MIRGVIYLKGVAKHMLELYPAAQREALEKALLFWHEKHLPRHFEPGAGGRYHYQQRAWRYNKKKMSAKGHMIPLVWTGDMMKRVTERVDISATARAARAALHGPRYLYAYRKNAKQPDKTAEILAMTHAEEAELGKIIDQSLTDSMNGIKKTETVRI